MNNQEIEVKVGMWIQIPKLTKKQEKQLNYEINVKSGKNYQIIDCYNSTNTIVRSWVEIEDDDLQVRTFYLENDDDLFGKPLILLDKNQQPLTKSIKKETVKESKPQITAQEMYIKELEKTAKSLREQVENLEEEVAIRDKVITNANKDIEHLKNKLDESYKEQEKMMSHFKIVLNSHEQNLIQTLAVTNIVKVQDIRVFTDICLRSLEKVWKFESKEN